MSSEHLEVGVVVGLAAEARIARGLQAAVQPGGGSSAGAAAAAERLVAAGVTALLSFGLAGGLSPDLPAGAIVIPADVLDGAGGRWRTDTALAGRFGPPSGSLLATDAILATAAGKHAAWTHTGALAADMESGAVAAVAARHGLPFAVLRAVCDPAGRTLPRAALTALDAGGRISPLALIRSVARHPAQVGALIALGREAALARAALLDRVVAAGPL